MSENTPKTYPNSSDEVSSMLGLNKFASTDSHSSSYKAAAPSGLPVSDLPVVESLAKSVEAAKQTIIEQKTDSHNNKDLDIEMDLKNIRKPSAILTLAKIILPYVVVFAVGVFLYFFFFSSVNFSDIFKTVPKVQTAKESAIMQLEKQGLTNYNIWISSFYFDVSDTKVLDPNVDNSGNGLTNFQKYLLNLNPKSYDTLGLGVADSQSLANGINPLTGNLLTSQQQQIVDKYFDMEVIMNKLTLAHLNNNSSVAGATTNNSFTVTPTPVNSYPTTNSPQVVQPINANDLDINTSIPGRLEIPDLKVNAPLIWSTDPANFEDDLKSGVIHYPGTALPGQIGTAYISGHSSNYAWAAGNFNHVFTKLDNLADNTSFKITVVQKNGKDAILNYVVTSRQQYLPTDQAQFQNSGKSVVALSTCWPVGSTARRLVVFGELTQVQK